MAKKAVKKAAGRAATQAAKAMTSRAVAAKGGSRKARLKPAADKKPALLSGGNPQIPKGYGNAPVRGYIAAIPDWKRDICRHLDTLVTRTIPNVRKAVKWNSPFYGVDDEIWFLSFHCFRKYVKVAFFRGASLDPVPPGTSSQKNVRYLDIYEDKPLDEARFVKWLKQASRLRGERM